MKFTTIITKDHEEEIILYIHEENGISEKIRALLGDVQSIVGYTDSSIVTLDTDKVFCFTVENGKVFALLEREKILVKERLYSIEEKLGNDFVKINQSCIANIKMIEKFDTSIGTTLLVVFKNGHRDYVSRRQTKTVKERIGF